MNRSNTTHRRQAAGVTLLITMVFLCLFACMAVAIAATTESGLLGARNERDIRQASAIAQAGVQMMKQGLGGLAVPATHDASDMHTSIATQLKTIFTGSTMVNPNTIYVSPTFGVILPTISVPRPDGRSGTLNLVIRASGGALDNTTITIQSTARFNGAIRTGTYNMTVQRGRSVLLDYGIASRSAVTVWGSARVTGANRPDEANILSATYSTLQAIQLGGSSFTSGSLAVCNPHGQITVAGSATNGGARVIGASEPEWPVVDITPFKPYVTGVYTGGHQDKADQTLVNVRIPPGTNPNFTGNLQIFGVLYIQSPNQVKFSGQTTITGTIVCETPTINDLRSNSIEFVGNTATYPVENLPADPKYNGLRDLKGSFVLAPGFAMSFKGSFGGINGAVVASQFEFSGDAAGRITGGLLNLRDSSFSIAGNSNIVINRDNVNPDPAGLTQNYRLVCVSGSYSE
jgi:hypothetical protein